MSQLRFEGWHLIGAFPDNEPDDVGSWILSHNGEAALVEVPEDLTVKHVKKALGRNKLCFATASHEHEDHFDAEVWRDLIAAFPAAQFIRPSSVVNDMNVELATNALVRRVLHAPSSFINDMKLELGGEPWELLI